MRRALLVAALLPLVLATPAAAQDETSALGKATGLHVVPALSVQRALAVIPACSRDDGIDWTVRRVRRASTRTVHLGVEGGAEWLGGPGTLALTITVKLSHGHLRVYNGLFGWYAARATAAR